MLKRFEVENFKCFKDRLVLDFTAGKFDFNQEIIKNNLVNKALIYGKNGSGKTSLGVAIFDIVTHLTDKEPMPIIYTVNYKNLNSASDSVKFKYVFQFDADEVVYEYEKLNSVTLLYEKLTINGKCVIKYKHNIADNLTPKDNYIDKDLVGDLNWDIENGILSVLKYIYRNTIVKSDTPFAKLFQFCNGMLWFRSALNGNTYAGLTSGRRDLVDMLAEYSDVKDFAKFLKDFGLIYDLEISKQSVPKKLMVRFKDGYMDFGFVASSGTEMLFLYYVWSTLFNKISFLFIDEFDVFLHVEAAERLVKQINEYKGFQTILTSHNTYLMNTELSRPDCCFIVDNGGINNLDALTDKQLMRSHNLEKMYLAGMFDE